MNKHFIKLLILVFIFVFGGCLKVMESDKFRTLEIPERKLKQIETLDLESMKADDQEGSAATIQPPAELMLTLEEVRLITLENNLGLNAELISPTIAAENVRAVEAAKYAIVFNAGITHAKNDSPNINKEIVGALGNTKVVTSINGVKSDQTNLNMGVSIPLQTGGSINFDLNDNLGKYYGDDQVVNGLIIEGDTDRYSTPLSFSVSQPLLKGAGKREFMHGIRLAKYNQSSVSAATKLAIINVLTAADSAYWDLYKKRKVLEVRQKQYSLAQVQLEKAKRMVDAGQSPQVEVLRAEAGLASQLSTIIAAENDLRKSQRNLKFIMNKPELSVDGPTVLLPHTDADPFYSAFDSDKLVSYAIDNRMELLQLEIDIAKNLSEIASLRNAGLPELNFQYRYQVNGLGTSRSDAYELLTDKDYENHMLGLNLRYPFGNKAAKSNLLASLYQRRQKLASIQDKEANIQQEVLNALDSLETTWQQILANRQSSILQGRLYQAELKQFEVGTRTSTEVLEAQASFADSQSAEYTALANYQIALIDLAKATGTLLGAAKVQWAPEVPDVGVK
ncbi:MAG: TolC family protein [Phycisphaerae bacterium]|nr:TolC family protein [Phycisphaerae bacterium]